MPIYPIKCSCGFAGDIYAKISDLDSKGRLPCSTCGKRAEQDYSHKTVGVVGDDLHGKRQRSIEAGCNPHEVPEARRLFGAAGHCWQDDGSVRFRSKTDARDFYRAEKRLKDKFKDKGDGNGS